MVWIQLFQFQRAKWNYLILQYCNWHLSHIINSFKWVWVNWTSNLYIKMILSIRYTITMKIFFNWKFFEIQLKKNLILLLSSILEYVSWNHLENSQDAVQSFVDTLYKMDMLLDKKKTSKNPQTKNTKNTTTINPYQCSFLYNFCFIARWQKRKFGFYQLLFLKHRTQTFYNISTNKKNKIFRYIKLQWRRE